MADQRERLDPAKEAQQFCAGCLDGLALDGTTHVYSDGMAAEECTAYTHKAADLIRRAKLEALGDVLIEIDHAHGCECTVCPLVRCLMMGLK